MKKLLLILNPCSGKKKASHALADVVNVFNRGGYDVTVYITAARGDATKVVAQRAPEFDLVVCAGGDGTFNETISGLLAGGHDTPIGYLPAGSTNDFASSLHLSKNLVEAARDIVEGTPRRLDVGRFNDRYFSYVASFGAFTRASYATSQNVKNALGHFAYILEGLGDLGSLRPYRCAVDADGERFEGEFIFGAVCNSTSLGGLVKLDPSRVRMDDGKFELLLLRMPKTALDLQNLITAMTRMQYDYPGVILRHVRRVTLTTEENLPWSLDGEYCPSAPRVEIENLPAAIQLVR